MISTPPTKAALVDAARNIALGWLTWLNAVRDHATFDEVAATLDPGSLDAGDGVTATATVRGARVGDFATASFDEIEAGITISAAVTAADTVSVTFLNLSGGTVDMASGTVRVRVSRRLT